MDIKSYKLSKNHTEKRVSETKKDVFYTMPHKFSTPDTSLRGFLGNKSAYVTLPVSLNGKYNVEFLYKATELGTDRRLIDFRYNSGVGYITHATTDNFGSSSGYLYVDKVSGATVNDTANLHLIECRGLTITSTQLSVLAAFNGTAPSSGFISKIRIFDFITGDLVYQWLFDEIAGTTVQEDTGNGNDGAITNYYSGLFSSVPLTNGIPYSNRYNAWRVSKIANTDCLITHDDGFKEALTIIAPLLQSKGMVANIAIVKTIAEGTDPAYLRLSDLIILRDSYGFGIVNHTTSHQSIASLLATSEADAKAEIQGCQDWLNSNGFDGDYFVYAQSDSYTPKTAKLAESIGIKVSRRPSINKIQEFPPLHPNRLTPISINNVYQESDMVNTLDMIDQAVATRSFPIIYGHNVKSDADASAANNVNVIGLTVYTNVIDRLKSLNINTLTMREWYQKTYL